MAAFSSFHLSERLRCAYISQLPMYYCVGVAGMLMTQHGLLAAEVSVHEADLSGSHPRGL